eukprot:6857023-Pyramimonas_sp.AAC.1
MDSREWRLCQAEYTPIFGIVVSTFRRVSGLPSQRTTLRWFLKGRVNPVRLCVLLQSISLLKPFENRSNGVVVTSFAKSRENSLKLLSPLLREGKRETADSRAE